MKLIPSFTLIYADEDIIVVNKRSGLLVAADRYDLDAPRLDKLVEKEHGTLFAVHRIDKDTSGLVVYARNAEAHRTLCMAFEERTVEKVYHALVYGRPSWESLHVDLPLQADGDQYHRTVANKRFGKPSVTDFRVLGSCPMYTWIEARPLTGRTHQIRVHLAENGSSIVCDPLYGGNQKPLYLSAVKRSYRGDTFDERPLLNRLALHAYSIAFAHPRTGEKVSFTAPYSKDMEAVRNQLSKIFRIDSLAGMVSADNSDDELSDE